MSDAKLSAAIRQAVEVQGVPWNGRGRIGTPDGLADQLTLALAVAPDMAETECVAAIIGESAQETDWFCSLVEYGGASARYAPYYGRGCIQLTWEANYRGFGQWLKGLGLIADAEAFVKNPALAAQWPYPWLTAIYYFVRHISASYWRSRNWNAISGLINAGSASYYVSGYELRSRSINAALAQLAGWAFTGGDSMPSADEIARAVWQYQTTLQGSAKNAGKKVAMGTIMQWLDDQFYWVPKNVWGHNVTRAGLPSDDSRAGKQVSTGTIMAYMDAFVSDLKNTVVEAVAGITQNQEVVDAVRRAIEDYIAYREAEPGSIAAAGLDPEVYVITAGETLKQIAEAHGTTVQAIVAANPGLAPNDLVAGQKITIPTTTTAQEAAA